MKFCYALSLVVLSVPAISDACSCMAESADEESAVSMALDDADLVFVGRIENTETRTNTSGFELQRTQFHVLSSWKGERANRIFLETIVISSLCGFVFPSKGAFLVYAYGPDEDGYYDTSICTRTKPSTEADREIAILEAIGAETASRTDRSSRSREERAPAER